MLPGPAAVLAAALRDSATGELPYKVAITLGRVVVSFSLAMVIGGAIGLALGRSPRADRFFDGWLIVISEGVFS